MTRPIRIGCSGWSYDHWIEPFYPPDLNRKDWLKYYAEYFSTVEVNMTFYRFPFPNILKSWRAKTPPSFKFTFKANRLITHVKKFEDTEELVKRFMTLLQLVGDKRACILWQLPPSMHFTASTVQLLDSFLSTLEPSGVHHIIEFRHTSWWNDETYTLLRNHNASFCIVSAPSLPKDFVITSDIAYIRFHGVTEWYRHNYSREELEEWATQIRGAKNCNEIYCYFNNDYEAYAPRNAMVLQSILEE
jgi:uncharacterized protein YecE (DUF72 family)